MENAGWSAKQTRRRGRKALLQSTRPFAGSSIVVVPKGLAGLADLRDVLVG